MSNVKETIKTADKKDYWNERVPVFIHRPESEKNTSRTVTVNGRNYQIAYDVQVMVPRFVAAVVEESMRNARRAQDRADEALRSGLEGI